MSISFIPITDNGKINILSAHYFTVYALVSDYKYAFGVPAQSFVHESARIGNQEARSAYAIEWNGRGLRSSAIPLCVTVGQLPVRHIHVTPDACSAEGILLARPKVGDRLVVHC